jgi:excisionase family DNA binding protein
MPGECSCENMAHRYGKQDPPAYLAVADAARALGYTPQHVRRLLRERRLEGLRIGRVWAVSRDAVKDFAGDRRGSGARRSR